MAITVEKVVPSEKLEVRLQSANRDDWEYVTVPEWDFIDEKPHPPVSINFVWFGPGTHLVPADVAVELRRILDAYRVGRLKLMNPRIDSKGIALSGTMFGSQGVTPVDPNRLQ